MANGTILVTGAGGFIGRAITERLLLEKFVVRGTGRRIDRVVRGAADLEYRPLEFPCTDRDLDALLDGVDCVVHLAAHVHIRGLRAMHRRRFHEVNATGTGRLAAAAGRRGLRRFVFMSSIGVNGDPATGRKLTESDPPRPDSAYAQSKLAAEENLRRICADGGLQFAILRVPLVFGARVGGTFLQLLRGIDYGLPFPLGSVHAQRSMVYVENLAHLVSRCLADRAAANSLFMVADYDVDVADLVRRLAALMSRPCRLWPCPEPVLAAVGHLPLLGRPVQRLTRPLLVDTTHLCRELRWSPLWDLQTALARTVQWYLSRTSTADTRA